MTQEIKYPEEIQEARFRNIKPEVNPHCAVIGCIHPGATIGDFCPYHKEIYEFKEKVFRQDFIRQQSDPLYKT